MRADRLVSLVLLLRQRGQMTADELSEELEVSSRTVLRDIEALSIAGVPVYAVRGRYGGFAMLPGFRNELTGLNHDEVLALMTAGSASGERMFGLDSALASAVRKVVDTLPAGHLAIANAAAQRLLVEPDSDLLSRRTTAEEEAGAALAEVRRAVLAGHKLRIHYAATGERPRWRTIDPIGLVTVRGHRYLLATRAGEDRTYRLSRILAAGEVPEPADRPDQVDLDRIWADRCAQFLSDGHIDVHVRVKPSRREELLNMARAARVRESDTEDWTCIEATFDDMRHAVWALWQLGTDAEALSPGSLRAALKERASSLAARYDDVR